MGNKEKIIIGILCILLLFVGYNIGNRIGERSVECEECPECPYSYFNYEINISEDVSSTYLFIENVNYMTYISKRYGKGYFNLQYIDFNKLKTSIEMEYYLYSNKTEMRITDIKCLNKYFNEETGMLPENVTCSKVYEGIITNVSDR